MQAIDSARVQLLNDLPARDGTYVLYWMQQSQRAVMNHALEYAVQRANERGESVVAAFGLTDHYPEANLRHYTFLLEGLRDTKRRLADRGLKLVVRRGEPAAVALDLAANASLVVCDRGYLRHQRQWRQKVARRAPCSVVQVESDVVVPVEVVSDKTEYAARTIRKKLHRHLDRFLVPVASTPVRIQSLPLHVKGLALDDLKPATATNETDVQPVTKHYRGGTGEAMRVFQRFLSDHLSHYAENRNQPQTDHVSHMSKYLHFGQISPLWLALEARECTSAENVEAFLEELLVRRELCMNFVHFTPDYDRYEGLPAWALKTLDEHRRDARQPVYTPEQLEDAATHDAYWNAAMLEMRETGYMHNYMRMYWGKKILEWSESPEGAFETVLRLNNRYFLDGRDANSFAGAAWVFGRHDRPWTERPVFGKTRYMNARGLERKCDIHAYLKKVQTITGCSCIE